MTLNEYQKKAALTITPKSKDLNYLALGLVSEAGEFAGKVKKKIRDEVFDECAAAHELGDVLWYVSQAAAHLGYSLEEIAQMNVLKLHSRFERGVIGGNGDER